MCKEKINGWISIDKPKNCTSADIVRKVKRISKAKKVGHGGTLDPLASGILPICFGEATKTLQYITGAIKEYEFDISFGQERETDDLEGQVIATSDKIPSKVEIEEALEGFIGEIDQVPPKFSAIKVDGQRAYKLAREGKEFELVSRKIDVYELSLISLEGNIAKFFISCGKGTYIRSIARDLGRKLDCYGHVSSLCRKKVGYFSTENAISVDKLEELVHNDTFLKKLMSLGEVLDDVPAINIDSNMAKDLRFGRAIRLEEYQDSDQIIKAMLGEELISLGKVASGWFKPVRTFNN